MSNAQTFSVMSSITQNAGSVRVKLAHKLLVVITAKSSFKASALGSFVSAHDALIEFYRVMKLEVRARIHQLEIFKTVISFYPVNVMNVFVSSKPSSKMLFHKIPVLKHPAVFHQLEGVSSHYGYVSSRVEMLSSFVASVKRRVFFNGRMVAFSTLHSFFSPVFPNLSSASDALRHFARVSCHLIRICPQYYCEQGIYVS